MRPYTPDPVWTTGNSADDFRQVCARLGAGPAVLRDWAKSMKLHWHEAAYTPDVSDPGSARHVAARFLELRGDDFSGGFVVRRFGAFTAAEVRTWWVAGECRLVTAHPDTPGDTPPADREVTPFRDAIRALRLPFVTANLTRHEAAGGASSRSATVRWATAPPAPNLAT